MKNITIIGAGNVGSHLYKAFTVKGFEVSLLSPSSKDFSYDLTKHVIDVLILSVPDDIISGFIPNLKINPNTIVCHTSGSVSIDVFKGSHENYGVFYPLQTFSKNSTLNYESIPFLIEGATKKHEVELCSVAMSISNTTLIINSREREIIHLAAVFANNFTNAMISISESILDNNDIDKNIIYPLIQETVRKATKYGASNSQTGPAKRGDTNTIQKQTSNLNEEEQKVYQIISEYIFKNSNNSK